ncbi:MAG TPA: DUF488 domain-containing protein [Longimicrobiaceae bacterium]|jgi:uncharacterized protein (DUF488 family)|nr:DUF488 domain-containing protein [Longimicrobiaceae bacterium]
MERPINTVGHSTRSIEEFLELLRENGVELLVDVRRFPGSRRFPQFGSEALAAALREAGIAYVHEPEMGGRRAPAKTADLSPSPNGAWRSAAFRAYADHTATPAFQAALQRLVDASQTMRPTVMCAEAVPWRCHRQLIADALVARGIRVLNIIGPGGATPHERSPHAVVLPGARVVYPAPRDGQSDLFSG